MTEYLLLPLTFLLAFLGCRLVIAFSKKHQWLDHPNYRSSHDSPTPTSGGLAIVIVFSLAVLVAYAGGSPGFNLYLVLGAGAVVAGTGLADDIYSLGIWSRIGVQLLVVLCALAQFGIPSLPVFDVVLQPDLLGYAFAILLFLWFINLFNFMDGIDGIAAMEALFLCASFYLLELSGDNAQYTQFLLLFMAAISGFLLLNLAPARIFMGDVGSNYLGFLLGVLVLASTVAEDTSLWTWLILAGLFFVDATVTLCVRVLKGETWYYAHRSHAYQRAAVLLGGHGRAVLAALAINCFWLLPLAWFAHRYPPYGSVLTIAAWLPLALLVRFLAKLPVTTQIA